jgi:ubiquinone/menaquinone biosynthesis C-methylase UbiE
MPAGDSVQRFSSRVENYVRYRPGYPRGIIDLLKTECGLRTDHVIADIAFGTGLFTMLLVEAGNRVIGVEPNEAMRKAGEEFLAAYPNFSSVTGTAEATTLPDHSLDFVTAAQAAHWFDLEKTRREFVRILKPSGWAVLVWNERRTGNSPFLREYEQMLLGAKSDYQEVRHEHTTRDIRKFFDPTPFHARTLEMFQEFDYSGLEGRVRSSSYTPQPGHPEYQPMIERLQNIFEKYQQDGKVTLEYDTRVYFGRLNGSDS